MSIGSRIRNRSNGQLILALAVVIILFGLSLPWPLVFDLVFEGQIFGIPTGFFLTVFGFPFVMLAVVSLYTRLAPDVETGDRYSGTKDV